MTGETFGFVSGTPTPNGGESLDVPRQEEEGDAPYEFIEREAGDYLPPILPGTVTFRYEEQEYNPADAEHPAQITFTAHIQTGDLPPGRILRGAGSPEIAVNYNRVNDRIPKAFLGQDGKTHRIPSGFQALYSCLGFVHSIGVPTSPADVTNALRGANGQTGKGKLAWQAFHTMQDGTKVSYTTARKKERRIEAKGQFATRVEIPWPYNLDGTLPTHVTFKDGEVNFTKVGQARIVELYAARKPKQ